MPDAGPGRFDFDSRGLTRVWRRPAQQNDVRYSTAGGPRGGGGTARRRFIGGGPGRFFLTAYLLRVASAPPRTMCTFARSINLWATSRTTLLYIC